MAVYRYIAFDVAGKRRRGYVEADDPVQARARLRGRELFASKISEGGARSAAGPSTRLWAGRWEAVRAFLRRDRSLEMALPLRELATLVGAGVPLAQSLEALADQSETRRLEGLFRELRDRVLSGDALSEAAAGQPAYFRPVAVNMLAAGETSGNLEVALRRLSEGLMRGRELAGKVTGALVYPAILGLISLSVVTFLLVYVVPRITSIYVQLNAELPRPTRLLLGISGLLLSHWLVILLALAGTYVGLHLAMRDERAAARWDWLKLRLPFLGPLFRKRCVAQFAGTLCGLLESGVPLVEGLRVTAGVLSNRVFAREVRQVAQEVELGRSTSRAVREGGVFPATVAEMIAAGEESGELVDLLQTLADDYARQVEAAADRACRALEPLVVVLMGGVVLFIVLSVLLPIVRVSQLVHI